MPYIPNLLIINEELRAQIASWEEQSRDWTRYKLRTAEVLQLAESQIRKEKRRVSRATDELIPAIDLVTKLTNQLTEARAKISDVKEELNVNYLILIFN
jgi:hypothetical protein